MPLNQIQMYATAISQIDDTDLSYHILVYGRPGTGKTIFASSWSRFGTVVFFDTDRGLLSVRSSKVLTNDEKSRIYSFSIPRYGPKGQPAGWQILKGLMKELMERDEVDIDENNSIRPDTIVLDSLTTAGQMSMDWCQLQNKSLGQQPQFKDYDRHKNELRRFIENARSMDQRNFIMTAHRDIIRDELIGSVSYVPLVVGSLRSEIGLYFDEVYHSELKRSGQTISYLLNTRGSSMIEAKTRLDLPASLPNLAWEVKKGG